MKRALLADTNFSAAPIRHALIAEGYEVWVVGRNSADALAVGDKNYVEKDYSDVDQLEAVARELQVQALVPGCNDVSYAACCEVAAVLGMPGFETKQALECLHNKNQFRTLCHSLSIPAPQTYKTIDEALRARNRIIIKPVDAYSGRGIKVLSQPSESELQTAMTHAESESRASTALVEEFVDGDLFSYSAFLSEGAVLVAFSVAEYCSVNPFTVDVSYLMPPVGLEAKLKKDVETLALELGIKSGLMHIQYIARGNDYWVIEPTRRCPGDLYSELIRYSTGFTYAEAYIAPFAGTQFPSSVPGMGRHVVRHTVASDRCGIFESLAFSDHVHLTAWYPLARTGDSLAPSPGGRIGVAFFGSADQSHSVSKAQEMVSARIYQNKLRDLQDAC